MQIVIEIPEEQYDALCMRGVFVLESQLPSFLKVLRNGTPLPKGHGDLIDRNKIAFDYWSVDGYVCVGKKNIFNMPVVVPADKEDAE